MRLRAHEPEMTGIDAEMRNVRAGDVADIKQEAFENNHRKIGKTVAAACILFTVGSLMIYFGVQALETEFDRGVSMCTVGSIAFLPGSYACWHLYGAWKKWPGYSYDLIPSYD